MHAALSEGRRGLAPPKLRNFGKKDFFALKAFTATSSLADIVLMQRSSSSAFMSLKSLVSVSKVISRGHFRSTFYVDRNCCVWRCSLEAYLERASWRETFQESSQSLLCVQRSSTYRFTPIKKSSACERHTGPRAMVFELFEAVLIAHHGPFYEEFRHKQLEESRSSREQSRCVGQVRGLTCTNFCDLHSIFNDEHRVDVEPQNPRQTSIYPRQRVPL